MKIILTALETSLLDAWRRFCDFDFVTCLYGSVTEQEVDAVISPANSFGFMDGGIDAHYTRFFGEHVEARLQRTIREDYDGELLVGQAVLVPTRHANIPYLIAAPTMRVPTKLPVDTVNPYLAAKAAIRCALRANDILDQYQGDPNARRIASIGFPGLGTGVGQIDPNLCAYQVARAIEDTLVQEPMYPYSWQDAVYRHDSLTGFGE